MNRHTASIALGVACFALGFLATYCARTAGADVPDIRPEPARPPQPVVVVVVRERERPLLPCARIVDLSDDVLTYPQADDEPPQRPWQELRAMGSADK